MNELFVTPSVSVPRGSAQLKKRRNKEKGHENISAAQTVFHKRKNHKITKN